MSGDRAGDTSIGVQPAFPAVAAAGNVALRTQTLPRCDCLNSCGDDPRVQKGKVRECDARIRRRRAEEEQQRQIAAERHALDVLGRIAAADPGSVSAEELVGWAQAALPTGLRDVASCLARK